MLISDYRMSPDDAWACSFREAMLLLDLHAARDPSVMNTPTMDQVNALRAKIEARKAGG